MSMEAVGASTGEDKQAHSSRQLKEFDKLDTLLSQIPRKAQHGILKSCDLILTCIDANKEYIALGSNVGVTFLYSRRDHSVQRFKSAGNNDVITSVKLHHGIDDQLATGTAAGDLVVYCMPGPVSVQKKQAAEHFMSDVETDHLLGTECNQILEDCAIVTELNNMLALQKFDVKGLHKHYISCLEWSTNGMKLYSGDKNGLISTTEVDFYQGQCTSSLLLVESANEIVQLDYRHKILLVSTRQRSFIVRLDLKCQVVSIGIQERKMPGSFGACFVPGMCKVTDAKLYAARPGCRLWLSDVDGVVRSTHIFSDPLSSSVPEISLLSMGKLQTGSSDFQFGNLKWFREKEIITWSNSALVVLDPQANHVLARNRGLNGIVDVAVVEDEGEIFVLRRHADARVIRISDKPEQNSPKVESVPVVPLLATEIQPPVKEEEKDKESGINSFFKKLAQPLKKLDKNLHDSKHAPELPSEPPVPEAVISPDLPPVVRLASPEMEGVRLFTGGTGNVPSPPSMTPVSGTTKWDDVDSTPTLSALMSATSVLGVVSNAATDVNKTDSKMTASASGEAVPQIKVEPTAEPVSGSPSVDSHFNTHRFRAESPLPVADGDGNSIVFSHRMKKHKKRKHKSSSLHPKEKDEDSISQLSASSQHSDDSFVGPTPHNTPAVHDSPLDTIQRADDMLRQVESILGKDRNASKNLSEPTVNVAQSVSNKYANTQNVNFPLSDAQRSENEKAADVSTLDAGQSASVVPGGGSILSQPEKLDISVTRGKMNVPDLNEQSSDIQSLPQSDQPLGSEHLGSDKPLDRKKAYRDASEILETAMANLHKSQIARDEAKQRQVEQPASGEEADMQVTTSNQVTVQSSFQDVFSEIEAIEATDPFHKGYKKVDPADDFYSNFIDTSPESPVSPVDKPSGPARPSASRLPPEAERTVEMQDIAERRLANSWSEFTTPTNMYSLVISNTHVWFTDKSENIYYSSIGSPKGIVWRKATGYANQISVSPTGALVWRLHRGVVYAGTKISSRHPEGLKWVEAVREVETMCVDFNCAWYVRRNGEVMMQRGLSQDRPCFKSKKVECSHKIKHIVCRYGVVWAITEGLCLLVRKGVSDEIPEGTRWELVQRDTAPYLFSHVTIDNENVGWAIDVLGQIWFCVGVSREHPLGQDQWWQVPMSEYILQDESTLDMIKAVARKFDPKKLSYILSTNRGGLITAGSQGVWLALDFKNVLQVCRGSVQGYHWLEAHPAKMSASTAWKLVSANIAHLDWGAVWAQHVNGDVYMFKGAQSEAFFIPSCGNFCCISAGPVAVWGLTPDGEVFIRTGVGSQCPQGSGWIALDLSQLGETHLVHLSCNSLYVWAVDHEGVVFQRIGAKPPSDHNLSPAWLPIDSFSDIVFTQVHTGPLDWMVWAVDNRRLTYVRAGITEELPIGQEWVHVPGIQAIDLAMTKTGVWALTPNGEIFFRYGIARNRPCGDYWKKIPGTFAKISASANDELWSINSDSQLMQCSVKYLTRYQDEADPLLQQGLSISSGGDDIDWEIV